jgi:tRNA(fMet)-specific endonuclease VapC
VRKALLDTSAYTALLGGDEKVLEGLADVSQVFMSVFVLGELWAGFHGGRKDGENRERLDSFLGKPSVSVLDATRDTAEIFGRIKDRLRRAGTPIPINDVWIAAHAVEHGAQIITYDRHFSFIPGLLLWEGMPGDRHA